jgi:hypothetical protein
MFAVVWTDLYDKVRELYFYEWDDAYAWYEGLAPWTDKRIVDKRELGGEGG